MHAGQLHSPTCSLPTHYNRDGKVADTPRRTAQLRGTSCIVARCTSVICFIVNVPVVASVG